MVLSNSQWLASTGEAYEIENSLRFNKNDDAKLTRTFGTATNRRKFTLSVWQKNGSSAGSMLEYNQSGGSTWANITIGAGGRVDIFDYSSGSARIDLRTTRTFGDPAAWVHLVVAFDTTQSTASNRIKVYINGEQQTDFGTSTYPSQNFDGFLNSAVEHLIGDGVNGPFDGYIAEYYFIDGQQLGPDSFGETNSKTGQWVPIETSGLTFGNNGFYLEFKDSSFIGKSTHQATGNEEMIPQDAGTIIESSQTGFSSTISFDNVTGTNYPTCNQWRLDIQPDDGAWIGKDYGADNTIVATGFKVYPTGDYGFDTWTNASSSSNYTLQLQGSNDGTNYTNIGSATSINGASSATKTSGLSNSTAYRYVRLLFAHGSYGGSRSYIAVSEVEFFGVGTYFNAQGITTADQMPDTPTNNFCTYNPLRIRGTNTISDGNLQAAAGSAGAYVTSTFGVSSGKWYWEYSFTGTFNFPNVGVMDTTLYEAAYPSQLDRAVLYYSSNGNKYIDSTGSSYGASYGSSDIVGVALNLDDNEITFYKNNSTQGTFSITNREYTPLAGEEGSTNGGIIANFGQSGFEYTPPTGFKALSTANLPDPAIADPSAHFQTTVYTGNGTAIGSGGLEVNQSENSTFQPDWVWAKNRTTGGNENVLYDAVRGVTKVLFSSTNQQEFTVAEGVTAFDSDGFTVGNSGELNTSGNSHVAWQWKANGSGSSNSDGNLTATVSANATTGFSIIKYQGTGSATTVGHGLGVAPKVVIVKDIDNSRSWNVFHDGLSAATKVIYLDQTAAEGTDSAIFGSAPTSSVVNIATGNGSNGSGINYIMYAFAEIPGYSKISSFVGNGSADGPFVHTGFAPAFIIFKNISASSQSWEMFDNKRDGFNDANRRLYPNANDAEPAASNRVRLVSNGFKIVTSGGTHVNGSGNTIIYWAFAESPFKTANAR